MQRALWAVVLGWLLCGAGTVSEACMHTRPSAPTQASAGAGQHGAQLTLISAVSKASGLSTAPRSPCAQPCAGGACSAPAALSAPWRAATALERCAGAAACVPPLLDLQREAPEEVERRAQIGSGLRDLHCCLGHGQARHAARCGAGSARMQECRVFAD